MPRTQIPRQRPEPQRSCVACREKKAKWELLRVVRTPQGVVEIDVRGKKSGRGAYLCRKAACWELALKKNRLDRALKIEVPPENRADLLEFARGLSATAGNESSDQRQGD